MYAVVEGTIAEYMVKPSLNDIAKPRISISDISVSTHFAPERMACCIAAGSSASTLSTTALIKRRWFEVRVKSPSV